MHCDVLAELKAFVRERSDDFSQGEYTMEFDMVFEGGGAKGMAFVGALRALEAGAAYSPTPHWDFCGGNYCDPTSSRV